MFVYGEDGLTLLALKTNVESIVGRFDIDLTASSPAILYRPSFGRRGGADEPQFGEFDFIIIVSNLIVLGESKWSANAYSTPARARNHPELLVKDEQVDRHAIMSAYINAWMDVEHCHRDLNHPAFVQAFHQRLSPRLQMKPSPPNQSRLHHNLIWVLRMIADQCVAQKPKIVNLLLYLYHGDDELKSNELTEQFTATVENDTVDFFLTGICCDPVLGTRSFAHMD